MKNKLSIILLIILTVTGCAQPVSDTAQTEEPESVEVMTKVDTGFELYIEKQCTLGLYEPEKGAYLGAYILSNYGEAAEIESFEQQSERSHGMYTYFMKMGAIFPTDWVLSCIANMKTPNIVLTPESVENPFNMRLLEQTAKKFGEFYVPMFVHFYPISADNGYDDEAYIAYFKKAKEIFGKYASNVAFVWSVEGGDLSRISNFYPGDNYVDWVGITMYETINPEEEMSAKEIFDSLDYFYYTFQETKPIMISQLGISHFTSKNHKYYSDEAGNLIVEFYKRIANEYPRIKAVNYMDYNGLDPVNMTKSDDDFSISGNENIMEKYATAVSSYYFIESVEFGSGGENALQFMKSPFKAVYFNSVYYVDENNIDFILGKNIKNYLSNNIEINGKVYYPINVLETDKRLARADFNQRKIMLN